MDDNLLFGACLTLYSVILIGTLVKIVHDGMRKAKQDNDQPREILRIAIRPASLQGEEPLYMQQMGRVARPQAQLDYERIYLDAINDLEEEWEELNSGK